MLVRALDVGHECHVDEKAVLLSDLVAYLSYRLQEGLGFDITGSATDFGDDHIGSGLVRKGVDEALYLIGHVGNDLDG